MRKILLSLLFCIVIISLIINLEYITVPKDRITILYNEFNIKINRNHDLLVFGSHHAYTSFNSLKLWSDYEISSYNVAKSSVNMAPCYLNIYKILKKKSPLVNLTRGVIFMLKYKYLFCFICFFRCIYSFPI